MGVSAPDAREERRLRADRRAQQRLPLGTGGDPSHRGHRSARHRVHLRRGDGVRDRAVRSEAQRRRGRIDRDVDAAGPSIASFATSVRRRCRSISASGPTGSAPIPATWSGDSSVAFPRLRLPSTHPGARGHDLQRRGHRCSRRACRSSMAWSATGRGRTTTRTSARSPRNRGPRWNRSNRSPSTTRDSGTPPGSAAMAPRGLINVNTASIEVLRTLPHMSRLVYNDRTQWPDLDGDAAAWSYPTSLLTGDVDAQGATPGHRDAKSPVGQDSRGDRSVPRRAPAILRRSLSPGPDRSARSVPLATDAYLPSYDDRGSFYGDAVRQMADWANDPDSPETDTWTSAARGRPGTSRGCVGPGGLASRR